MERNGITRLEAWKNNPRRKPLLLLGARQVGKTWLAQEFAKKHYRWMAYVRFDKDAALRETFGRDFNVKRLLNEIQLSTGVPVEAGETLIILDEIQDCPAALTALKYFCEEAREQHIIAAGSLLGVELHHGVGFPVGKVDRLMLHPLSYTEFLTATGNGRFVELLRQRDWETIMRFRNTYEDMLRYYYYIGGMPEAVNAYLNTGQFTGVREVQLSLLDDYRSDFSKHAPGVDQPRIAAVWDSVPTQLADNRRFVLAEVSKRDKTTAYRTPIQWLLDAGLLHTSWNVRKPELPLAGNKDAQFRLYHLDMGLLAAQSKLDSAVVVERNGVFKQFKGALTEQYVHQQLLAECAQEPYFWLAEKSQAEIDFLLETARGVVPLEVKAERNLTAKSLRSYCRRFSPAAIARTSMHGYERNPYPYTDSLGHPQECSILDIPLFAVSQVMAELDARSGEAGN